MPIASTLAVIKQILDGVNIPGNAGQRIEAFVMPPDPETEQRNPHAYIWSTRGPEKRDSGSRSPAPLGAAQPGPRPPSGWKILRHEIQVYLTAFDDNTNPQGDSSFPNVIDMVMNTLRCCQMPLDVIDPASGMNCQLINLGEVLSYEWVPVRSTASQRIQRQDALITAPVEEWIQA